MGTKGFIRSVSASVKRAEREAQKRKRELTRQQAQLEKMQEIEQAAFEVEVYENLIQTLISVHIDCGLDWDWEAIKESPPPIEPLRNSFNHNSEIAENALQNFKPSLLDKLTGKKDSKIASLKTDLEQAKEIDEEEFHIAIKDYETERDLFNLAPQILNQEHKSFVKAIQIINPFSEISEIGTELQVNIDENLTTEISLFVNGNDVIPKEVKTQLKSGKLSIKAMNKSKFNELYQDYICSAVLRVAQETFAILPINSLRVHAIGEILNPQTGHIESQCILSVNIPKQTLEKLNMELIDPSDSMGNFVHNMKFSKTKGFSAVEKLEPIN